MSQPNGASGVTHYVTPRTEDRKAAPKPANTPEPVPVPTEAATPESVTEAHTPVDGPTMGFRAFWYGIVRSINPDAKPPRLSKKEIAARNAQALIDERNRIAHESYLHLRGLTDACPHLVVVFIGVKGAAATTTTMVNVASTIADDTRTLVYGADFNPASGTAGARLGKEFGETVSIQEFAAIVERVRGDRRSVNELLRPTRYGVRVLSADDYTKIPGEQYGTTTAKMLEVLDENCDYLLLDTPNDITTPAARAVLGRADIIVFTANAGNRDSLRLLRTSMDTVRELGHVAKVADSVVVVSNAPSGATPDDYEKYLGQTNLRHEVTGRLRPGEFNGQMHVVPADPVIALDGEVNLEAYDPATLQAYRDIDIAIFEQALVRKSRSNLTALGRSTQ